MRLNASALRHAGWVGLAAVCWSLAAHEPSLPNAGAAATPTTLTAAPQVARLLHAGSQLYVQNRLPEASAMVSSALSLDPAHPGATHLAALINAKQRAQQAAIAVAASLDRSRYPRIPQQAVTLPGFVNPAATYPGGGVGFAASLGGGFGIGGLGGGGWAGGGVGGAGIPDLAPIARVVVAPLGAGGAGQFGGISYVTIPTPTLRSQLMVRQFFSAAGLP